MRDPLFVRARPFVSELTAEHADRRQLGREPGFDQPIPPGDGCVAEQIAGFPDSAYKIYHIAPRVLVTACSPSLVAVSFHFAARALYALAHIGQEILAVASSRLAGAASRLLARGTFAQAFPSKPFRRVMPYTPGGSARSFLT